MAALPLFSEVIDRTDTDNKVVTSAGKVFVTTAIFLILLSIFKLISDNLDKKQVESQHSREMVDVKHSDSTQVAQARIKILDTLGMVGISAEEIKKKIDSLKNKPMPIANPQLDLNEAPYFTKLLNDNNEYCLSFNIKNFGKGIAKKINRADILIIEINGQLVIKKVAKVVKDFDFLEPGESVVLSSTTHIRSSLQNQKIYYFLKVTFQNEKNQYSTPLRLTYSIPPPKYEGQQVPEINIQDYNKVKSFLVNNKMW